MIIKEIKIRLLPLIIFFLIPVFNNIQSQNYWIRQTSPVVNQLNKFIFTDSLNGWAVGDSGVIIHSSNGGNNWVVQNSTFDFHYVLYDVFFLNQRLGWSIAHDYYNYNSFLIRTTNGGINWNRTLFQDSVLNTIYFVDSLNGFAGELYGAIFKTTNGGVNWSKSSMYNSYFNFWPKISFRFFDSQNGLVCGGIHEYAGTIYSTTDSGLNWQLRDSALGEPINDLVYLDSSNILGAGGDFEYGAVFLRSQDKGQTWENNYLPYAGYGKAIAPRTRSEIWIPLGSAQKWVLSNDSGNRWQAIQVEDSQAINYAKFIDPYHGWAVGSNGAIYKYNTGIIGINPSSNIIPKEYMLFQNFPNPFNPKTIINYQLPGTNFVHLSIFDILGREVAVLVNEKQNIGVYDVEWDGTNFPSGIYFYRLQSGYFSKTKKMILVK